MHRRQFIRLASLAATGGLWHDLAIAETVDPWREGFATALANNPYLAGYKGVAPDVLLDADVAFEGRLPDGLSGTLYRNGPALHEMGGLRYHHWFDGDGMVQAFRIGDGRLAHRGRLVLTDKLKAEIAAGRRRRDAFGTAIACADPVTGPDPINVANTSIIAHANELLALWEGGSAYGLEPTTLETRGPKVWRADLAGLPFSAHPKVDTTGVLWNFGLDTANSLLVLYRIAAAGEVADAKVLRVPDMTMIHDFVVTAKHLVFLLPPIRFAAEKFKSGLSFNESHEWNAGAALRVLVVDKSNLATHRLFDLPSGFVFHFGNAWEDNAGRIRFDYVRAEDARTLNTGFRDIMRGVSTERLASRSMLVTLDLAKGTIGQEMMPGDVEFPRVDPRNVGQRYTQLFHAARIAPAAGQVGFDGIRRVDIDSGRTDTWRYGDGVMAEEHLFVPDGRQTAEGAGWLLGTSLDVRKGRTTLSVFDARRLADGPVAWAHLPYALPLGLHGNFKAA